MRRITLLFLGVLLTLMLGILSGFSVQAQDATGTPTPTTTAATATASPSATATFMPARFKILFAESNQEPGRFDRSEIGLSRFTDMLRLVGGEVQKLEWRTTIPSDVDLVVITGPLNDLTAEQTARLWAYLSEGGSVLLFAEPAMGQTRGTPLSALGTLFSLTWTDMGFRARNDVVVIEGPARFVSPSLLVTPRRDDPTPTLAATFEALSLVENFTATTFNAEHPITAGIEGEIAFFGARSIEFGNAVRGTTRTSLITSSNQYWGETDYTAYRTSGRFTYAGGKDTTKQPLILAAALETSVGARFVVIGDREIAVNGFGLRTISPDSGTFAYPANAKFLLNTVSWLLKIDPPAVTFPTPIPSATVTPTTTPGTATPQS
jgi:hypothetical protein